MPRIFDNIEHGLLLALRASLGRAERADFCVGYFNLRGWRLIDECIQDWPGGEDGSCRLLIGMQRLPLQEWRAAKGIAAHDDGLDNQTALRLKRKAAEEFREQLVIGAPSNADEEGLRRLSAQLKARKLAVKLHLKHPLHAKLYLVHREDPDNPTTGYLGSSNLTLAGLQHQGELNVDVVEHDACIKLTKWFDDRWNERWCLDISDDLIDIIDSSWAREELIPPYHIYLKIAYHLSQEARAGLAEFRIPRDLANRLFDFQVAAVKIAAHHLDKRGGVLIGDVVGLGKTLMATTLARMLQDELGPTLIICPKNLLRMWEDHRLQYGLNALVMPITEVHKLADLRRFQLVLIDESHNLRNREGRRYRMIQEYINQNDAKLIMLTATPYNKSYLDLSGQLRLFIDEQQDIGIRPEQFIREIGETEFIRRHQAPVRSLAAFEKSAHADDWRELMRLYLVRRTRTFIMDNYAALDPGNGRKYLTFEDGTRSYFPTRTPKTVKFRLDERDPCDPYARMFAPAVVDAIDALHLPRYGLGNYVAPGTVTRPTSVENEVLRGLGRAGQRLKGFSRTNLFKRLESGGPAFLQSVERHILRNFVYLHAIERGVEIPIGTQEPELFDAGQSDEDAEGLGFGRLPLIFDDEAVTDGDADEVRAEAAFRGSEADYRARAAQVYAEYAGRGRRRFKWLRPALFIPELAEHLSEDARALLRVLDACGDWDPARDAKLDELVRLLSATHPREKMLIFTQYADTVRYLTEQLRARGISAIEGVTGEAKDPTALAYRFSPASNGKRQQIAPRDELRVLVATDVLSEGQNLQDAAIVVNFDLPWAIIRLIQRAGRVDRIGQTAERILVYSFLPAEGVERIIRLRRRVVQRLRENTEVLGADEAFFEDGQDAQPLRDLYSEKAGLLDGDAEGEVDLASQAYQIWKNATDADPSLVRKIQDLPDVVYSSRAHAPTFEEPEGVIVYLRTAEGADALALIDREGRSVTQSQLRILQLAACRSDTPAIPRDARHHDLVQAGIEHLAQEERSVGGQLGRPSGARFKTYERLKRYADHVRGTLWDTPSLHRAVDDVYRYPLRSVAADTLNRRLREGIEDHALADLAISLREEGRLSVIHEDGVEDEAQEPRIICSLGLFRDRG